MSGYNPNASMLPASGGNIVAMSGGGVAKQHPSGGGAGLVFANGGSRKRKLRQSQSGGVPAHLVPQSKSSAIGTASTAPASSTASTTASTTASSAPVPGSITTVSVTTSSTPAPATPALAPPSDPNNIDDILIKLIGSLPKTRDIYTNEEQDSLLKNLTLLLNSDTNKKFTIEIK